MASNGEEVRFEREKENAVRRRSPSADDRPLPIFGLKVALDVRSLIDNTTGGNQAVGNRCMHFMT